MFGWLRRRERREHIKLLKQNELAAQYLADFQENAIAMRGAAEEELLSTLTLTAFAVRGFLTDLESYRLMPPERFSEQFAINKNLRRLYDEVLVGRKAFAKQFGSATEKIENFESKFTPDIGWKIYLERFPVSLEEQFNGSV